MWSCLAFSRPILNRLILFCLPWRILPSNLVLANKPILFSKSTISKLNLTTVLLTLLAGLFVGVSFVEKLHVGHRPFPVLRIFLISINSSFSGKLTLNTNPHFWKAHTLPCEPDTLHRPVLVEVSFNVSSLRRHSHGKYQRGKEISSESSEGQIFLSWG